ncbi:unnamed protein product [Closterium sp. NIES-65]|nr:unnamed protein product [Closterium sp. NIES-65]
MAEPQDPPHVLHELTERRDIDLLSAIFAKLPFKTILAASQVCRFWSHASEHLFHRECERKGWKPPRRPRGQTELSSFRPWRSLFFRHACRSCGGKGEFIARHAKLPPVSTPPNAPSAKRKLLGACTPGKKLLVSNPHAERNMWFLLCLQCTRLPRVQLRLAQLDAHVDIFGLTGSKLKCPGWEDEGKKKRKKKGTRGGGGAG